MIHNFPGGLGQCRECGKYPVEVDPDQCDESVEQMQDGGHPRRKQRLGIGAHGRRVRHLHRLDKLDAGHARFEGLHQGILDVERVGQ